MPKAGYLNVKVDNFLKQQIMETAQDDDRTVAGQITHLLRLGLKVRAEHHCLLNQATANTAAREGAPNYHDPHEA